MTTPTPAMPMIAKEEEMDRAKLDHGYRDECAHLLIPLNACRRREFYLPWKCTHERHSFEKCQYLLYKRRTELKAALDAEKKR